MGEKERPEKDGDSRGRRENGREEKEKKDGRRRRDLERREGFRTLVDGRNLWWKVVKVSEEEEDGFGEDELRVKGLLNKWL